MSSRKKLDLIGVVSPVCLLKSKSVLAGMKTGDMLEILLQDPEVSGELVKIIERKRSGDNFGTEWRSLSDLCGEKLKSEPGGKFREK